MICVTTKTFLANKNIRSIKVCLRTCVHLQVTDCSCLSTWNYNLMIHLMYITVSSLSVYTLFFLFFFLFLFFHLRLVTYPLRSHAFCEQPSPCYSQSTTCAAKPIAFKTIYFFLHATVPTAFTSADFSDKISWIEISVTHAFSTRKSIEDHRYVLIVMRQRHRKRSVVSGLTSDWSMA